MSIDEKNLTLEVEEPPTPKAPPSPPPKPDATALPIPIVNQDDKGLSHNDKIDMILNRLNEMEQRYNQPKEKPKRKATAKQLEVLAKAREARKANMSKRKEIKENMKVQEKKIVETKLQEEKIKSSPPIIEDVKPTSENVVTERTPNKPTNFTPATRNTPVTRANNIQMYQPNEEETREQRRNRIRNKLNFK